MQTREKQLTDIIQETIVLRAEERFSELKDETSLTGVNTAINELYESFSDEVKQTIITYEELKSEQHDSLIKQMYEEGVKDTICLFKMFAKL